MTTKRVTMITPEGHAGVHDGEGGVHLPGSSPSLPEQIADAFIRAGLAVPFGGTVSHEQRMDAAMKQEAMTLAGRKELAEQIMRNHDNLTPQERQEAHERVYTAPDERVGVSFAITDASEDEIWPDDVFSTLTRTQEPSPGSSQQRMVDLPLPQSRTASQSSRKTKRSRGPETPPGGPETTSD